MTGMTSSKAVGKSLKRVEDSRLLRGDGEFIADIKFSRAVHAAFLRSPHPHARIVKVDADLARTLPGVLAIKTGDDLKSLSLPLRVGDNQPDLEPLECYPLAVGKVRMVGDLVAVIVAQDRYIAEDAMDLIEVQYDPLPPIADTEQAVSEGAALVDDALQGNTVSKVKGSYGDVDNAFHDADLVVQETYQQQRYTHAPIECRGTIAYWNPGEKKLTVWSSTQWPHVLRRHLTALLGVPAHKVRVIAPDVGGGFGQKQNTFREDIVIPLLSMELGVPVKWIEDRRENLSASAHAREHKVSLEVAVKADGIILGIRAHITCDMGAYPLYPWLPNQWVKALSRDLPSPYKIANYGWEIDTVLTNKAPETAYRAPGATAANWSMESIIDTIAMKLNLDPLELRLKNMIRMEDQPYRTGDGREIDAITPYEALQTAAELIGYKEFRQEQRKALASGTYLGIGFGNYIKGAGYPTTAASIGQAGHEVVTVQMDPTGKVQAFVGVSPHGQGLKTTFAQVLADEIGISVEDVEILCGDTDAASDGTGTWGSRSVVAGGGALRLAGQGLRNKITRLAANLLEVPVEEVIVEGGYVLVQGKEEKIPVSRVAETAFSDTNALHGSLGHGLVCTRRFESAGPVYSNGAHMAIVQVDPETGVVTIKRYVAVEDVGPMINPMIADGQIRGAVLQGLGGAFVEEIVYDNAGQLLTTTLMDYLLPGAVEAPDIEVCYLETPPPSAAGKFKSLGELGIGEAIPAVATAVADALASVKPQLNCLPLKPDRVLLAIRRGRAKTRQDRDV